MAYTYIHTYIHHMNLKLAKTLVMVNSSVSVYQSITGSILFRYFHRYACNMH